MEKQISYSYAKISLEQFAIFEENYDQNQSQIEFQTQLQFSFDHEQNVICNSIVLSINQNQKAVLKAEQRSYFEINNDSVEMLRNEQGKIEFSPQLLVQFASLNYGSMRGSIHIKTLGSPINRFILPPIYFNKMIETGFVVE